VSNTRMKLSPRAAPGRQEVFLRVNRRRGRRVSRAVQRTPRATAWRSLFARRYAANGLGDLR
jgi:hypothetical protein